MVKIEVTVVENKNDSCVVTVRTPKHYKTATEQEKKTANVLRNSIDNAFKELSKGEN